MADNGGDAAGFVRYPNPLHDDLVDNWQVYAAVGHLIRTRDYRTGALTLGPRYLMRRFQLSSYSAQKAVRMAASVSTASAQTQHSVSTDSAHPTPTGEPLSNGSPHASSTASAQTQHSVSTSTKKEETRSKTEGPPPTPSFEEGDDWPPVPDWVPQDAWQSYFQHRQAMPRGKRLTPNAARLLFKKLAKLRDQGNDPGEVLEQSVLGGWQGIFAVKDGSRSSAPKTNDDGTPRNVL